MFNLKPFIFLGILLGLFYSVFSYDYVSKSYLNMELWVGIIFMWPHIILNQFIFNNILYKNKDFAVWLMLNGPAPDSKSYWRKLDYNQDLKMKISFVTMFFKFVYFYFTQYMFFQVTSNMLLGCSFMLVFSQVYTLYKTRIWKNIFEQYGTGVENV